MKHLIHTTCLALALALPAAAATNDGALYDPTPPADSAFVRVINALPGNDHLKAEMGGASFGDLGYPGISDYHVIKSGEQKLSAGAINESITVEAGKYYTIAVLPANGAPKALKLEDALIEKPSKAYIYLYNLSDAAKASLNAPAQKVDVISDLAPGEGKDKEINALTVDLAVMADGAKVEDFKSVALKRRTGFSFVVAGTKGSLKAVEAENHIKQ